MVSLTICLFPLTFHSHAVVSVLYITLAPSVDYTITFDQNFDFEMLKDHRKHSL